MRSPSRAWLPAPPRCFWSIAAPEPSLIADARIGLQRALAPCFVVDDWRRIGPANLNAGARQLKRCRFPRPMDHLARQARQLRYPAPHVIAVGIELLALQDRVEHPEMGRSIGAGACDPLPVGRIAAGVGIDQRIPKPLFALAPV